MKSIRCAIYTRKSFEQGLEQENHVVSGSLLLANKVPAVIDV